MEEMAESDVEGAFAAAEFPPQDPYSDERRVYGDDTLSFNPWHGSREHQPIGSIQRVRRPVYDDSSTDRHRHNAPAPTETGGIAAPARLTPRFVECGPS